MFGIVRKLKKALYGPSSDEMLEKLKWGGADIGEKVWVFDPKNTVIDETRPWLLKIGSYTKITTGVIILTHDYSVSVLRRAYGEWLGEGAVTEIGENVFIGVNSTVLMGTHIGNNVIVGAGSVVSGTIPDNCVVAGNPARVIRSLDEQYQKRKEATKHECKDCVKRFKERRGRYPTPAEIGGFKFLFEKRDKDVVSRDGLNFDCHGDEASEVEESFYSTKPYWDGYEKLIEEIEMESRSQGENKIDGRNNSTGRQR